MFGIVQRTNGDYFDIVFEGRITGLSGLNAGQVYFLSPNVEGTAINIEPTGLGEISKPVYIATRSTICNTLRYRGIIIS